VSLANIRRRGPWIRIHFNFNHLRVQALSLDASGQAVRETSAIAERNREVGNGLAQKRQEVELIPVYPRWGPSLEPIEFKLPATERPLACQGKGL
jgi:hypothetical protein